MFYQGREILVVSGRAKRAGGVEGDGTISHFVQIPSHTAIQGVKVSFVFFPFFLQGQGTYNVPFKSSILVCRACMRACVHACVRTYTYIYIHIHIHRGHDGMGWDEKEKNEKKSRKLGVSTLRLTG